MREGQGRRRNRPSDGVGSAWQKPPKGSDESARQRLRRWADFAPNRCVSVPSARPLRRWADFAPNRCVSVPPAMAAGKSAGDGNTDEDAARADEAGRPVLVAGEAEGAWPRAEDALRAVGSPGPCQPCRPHGQACASDHRLDGRHRHGRADRPRLNCPWAGRAAHGPPEMRRRGPAGFGARSRRAARSGRGDRKCERRQRHAGKKHRPKSHTTTRPGGAELAPQTADGERSLTGGSPCLMPPEPRDETEMTHAGGKSSVGDGGGATRSAGTRARRGGRRGGLAGSRPAPRPARRGSAARPARRSGRRG